MLDILWNIVSFIVALSILVAVHEWGHYYVAKLCNVKILKYSIGFGKPLYQRESSSGMQFIIAAIPLGGYVRMLDGRVDHVGTQDLDVAFDQKTVLQRMAIVAAGPAVNFIFAIFALMLVGLIGKDSPLPIIDTVIADSYAAQAQLEKGDQIVAIGGQEVRDWQGISIEMVSYSGDDTLPITVVDNNGIRTVKTLPIEGWKLNPDSNDLFGDIGFIPFRPKVTTKMATIEKDTPASRATMQANDKILKIDGTPMANWRQIVEYLTPRPNTNIVIEVQRGQQIVSLDVLLGTNPDDSSIGYLGVRPFAEPWPQEYIVFTQLGPIDALVEGTKDTWRLMSVTVTMLGKLITGDLSVKSLSGPISIAQGAGANASYGIVYFLGFLAIISVNLGIINLLPLPILDGGHLLYFTIELITGKPVSESIQEVGFKIGGVIIFAVMVTAIFNDILRNT